MSAKREQAGAPPASVVEPGSARYFAWLYADPATRARLEALLAIEQHIEASLRPGVEHAVAHARLAWWHEECLRFARGVPVHPEARRLLECAGDAARGVELRGLVEATAWDLASATPETRSDLVRHCERWGRAMIAPLVDRDAGAERVDAFGAALREMELLLRAAPDARHGRLRVPLEELDAIRVDPRALANPPWPQALATHLRARFRALRTDVEAQLPAVGSPSLHAWAAVMSAAARRAMRALPASRPERRFDGLADAVHAWRGARAARGAEPAA